jgi:hypothetical protein
MTIKIKTKDTTSVNDLVLPFIMQPPCTNEVRLERHLKELPTVG